MTGYNDPPASFGAAVDAVMAEAAAQGIPEVIWLTMRVPVTTSRPAPRAPTFETNNRTLLQKAQQYGGALQIADWSTYSAGQPSWVIADGFHLSARGAAAAATYIADVAAQVLDGATITPPAAPVGFGAAAASPAPGSDLGLRRRGRRRVVQHRVQRRGVGWLRRPRWDRIEHTGSRVAESRDRGRVRPRRRLRAVDQALRRRVVGSVDVTWRSVEVRAGRHVRLTGHGGRVRGRCRSGAVDDDVRRWELERLVEPRRHRDCCTVGDVGVARHGDRPRSRRRRRAVGAVEKRVVEWMVDARGHPDHRARKCVEVSRHARRLRPRHRQRPVDQSIRRRLERMVLARWHPPQPGRRGLVPSGNRRRVRSRRRLRTLVAGRLSATGSAVGSASGDSFADPWSCARRVDSGADQGISRVRRGQQKRRVDGVTDLQGPCAEEAP